MGSSTVALAGCRYGLWIAVFLSSIASADAQTEGRLAVGGHFGVGLGGGGAVILGAGLHGPENGTVTPVLSISHWWLGAGCDLIVGATCFQSAVGTDIGGLVRLGTGSSRWHAVVSARAGGLFFGGLEKVVWNPSLGIGIRSRSRSTIGLRAEVRYHAVLGNQGDRPGYFPPTHDYVVLELGARLRL